MLLSASAQTSTGLYLKLGNKYSRHCARSNRRVSAMGQTQPTRKTMRRQARSNKTDTAQPPVSTPPDLRSMPVIALEREAGQQAGSPILAGTPNEIDPDLRHQMISEAAYQLYVDGGYRDGHELDDWLQAEAEVDRVLANQ